MPKSKKNNELNDPMKNASEGDLEDDLRGITIPVDPETGSTYGYSVKGSETFELCSNFSVPGQSSSESYFPKAPYSERPYGLISANWEHDSGYDCFERTIDPDFFRSPQATN